MKPKITALIYTKNEEELLAGLLENLNGAVDEVLVLDGGSTDRTKEIALKMGARFIKRRKKDLLITSESMTNYYMKLAKNNWILRIDADELLEQPLKSALPQMISDKNYKAYRFRRKNYHSPNTWWKYGTYYPNYQLRLFDRRFVKFLKPIHVEPEVRGKIRNVELDIVHLKYRRSKARILAQHLEYAGGENLKNKNILLFPFLYPFIFIYFFFFKLGVLEPACWSDLALKRAVYYSSHPHHSKSALLKLKARLLEKIRHLL